MSCIRFEGYAKYKRPKNVISCVLLTNLPKAALLNSSISRISGINLCAHKKIFKMNANVYEELNPIR